ncbi:hypothetical protein V1512DRAFT_275242 [Lipomyces arxii]|uniref:uncharacterized protein n=1 Tax=Lipomyces arxii TaxID=56418 RepID=UPI0034CECB6F
MGKRLRLAFGYSQTNASEDNIEDEEDNIEDEEDDIENDEHIIWRMSLTPPKLGDMTVHTTDTTTNASELFILHDDIEEDDLEPVHDCFDDDEVESTRLTKRSRVDDDNDSVDLSLSQSGDSKEKDHIDLHLDSLSAPEHDAIIETSQVQDTQIRLAMPIIRKRDPQAIDLSSSIPIDIPFRTPTRKHVEMSTPVGSKHPNPTSKLAQLLLRTTQRNDDTEKRDRRRLYTSGAAGFVASWILKVQSDVQLSILGNDSPSVKSNRHVGRYHRNSAYELWTVEKENRGFGRTSRNYAGFTLVLLRKCYAGDTVLALLFEEAANLSDSISRTTDDMSLTTLLLKNRFLSRGTVLKLFKPVWKISLQENELWELEQAGYAGEHASHGIMMCINWQID